MKGLLSLLLSLCLGFNTYSQTSQSVNVIVTDYETRVTQNGGSISSNDLAAVSNFVTAAKDHQYWDKLIDIGPLAGNNISAALVKLKYPTNTGSVNANTGFLSSDYLPDQGLQLNPSKSLNTNTNISTLNLQGLFGFSMWLKNGGSGWMGSPNNNTPYSILLRKPTTFEAYIGLPPNFATVTGSVPSSTDAFYHVIKQSLSSTKVFVNNHQVGNTSSTPTSTQLRNANVEVFRDAGSGGQGLFYCIDNGRLTDTEVSLFHADVQQLMYDLGRRIAPPVISADGSYTTTQNVTITQTPTTSSTAGATIHYTTDGSLATSASPVYTAPLTISATRQVQAIAVKNGKTSLPANAWIAIVPPGFNTNKYYTAHVMINLLAFTPDMRDWLNTMKASGYNLIWAHLDDYTGNYVTTLQKLMATADSIGGIQIMPGASPWVAPNLVSHIFQDTWNHPSLFRIGDKRVYTNWDYQPDNQPAIDSLLALQNMPRDQYYLWASSRYPFSWDGGNTWVGEHVSPNGYLMWHGNSSAGQEIDIAHLYQTRPQLDGLINFAVDQGAKENTIRTNRLVAKSSIPRGKFSMGGVSAFYASVSYTDFGFKGAAEIWDSVLALPLTGRPTAMSDVTANDYAELSYMSPMVVPPANGLSYIPPFSGGFNLGDNVRYPLTDHSGIQKFLRPWSDAFRNNQPAPTFTQDRMFAWYWLHPKDAAPNTVLPSIFNGYAHLNQQWWNNTVYATGNINIGGTNQIAGMKNYLGAGMNKIRMAAHLMAPAYLKINDVVSELKPAGVAYFEIDMGSFRGTPSFSIVRSGVVVKSGEGLQPITDNVFPGGWNFLATEITEAASRHFRSKGSGSWGATSTWESSADSIGWSNATAVPSSNANVITVQNGHTVVITDSAIVDQLHIQNGATLNVASNTWLQIDDAAGDDIVIAPNGRLVIQSNSTGTGRIANSQGTIAGSATVEQYIPAAGKPANRLLSPSVNTANSSKPFIRDNWQEGQNNTSIGNNTNAVPNYGLHITGSVSGSNGFDANLTGLPSLFMYNQTSLIQGWTPAGNTNATNLSAKKGYLVYIRGDRSTDLNANSSSSNTTLRATGSIATGTQTFINQEGNGRNSLVTNPYPCPVDWSLIYNDPALPNAVNFENFYTYFDPAIGISGGYVTVSANGTQSNGNNTATEVQSGQAFFIKAKPGVVSPTFTVKESHKIKPGNNGQAILPPAQQAQLLTSLYFSTTDGAKVLADGVNAVFHNSFSAAVDGNDAEEIANGDENIGILRDGKILSIERRPLIMTTDTLPLLIQRLRIQNYEWRFNAQNFTHPNIKAFLEDKYSGSRSQIHLTTVTVIPFSVNADSASIAPDRFRIVFAPVMTLPVTMRSVKAYQKAIGIQVDWVTEYERNVDRYEIEKSLNGRQFIKVGTVQVYANNSLTKSYNWFDVTPGEGNNYYRIKEIDKNGTVQYSGVVNVRIGGKKESFEVFPNPLTGNNVTIQLNSINKGMYTVHLLNGSGQKLFSKIIDHAGGSASQTITLNSELPTGNYNLQISGKNVFFNRRIVK